MPETKNKYQVTHLQQLIDLNGDFTNFRLKFTCRAENETDQFEVLVLNQAQLESQDPNNLKYKPVTGQISGEIVADKNVYQNYFLLMKAPKDCVVEVISNLDQLPDNIPIEQQSHYKREQMRRQHQQHQQQQQQQQHQHQQHQQHRQHQQHQQHQQQTPAQTLQKKEEKKSFLSSPTFLWVVVSIVAIFLVYFIFFYKKTPKTEDIKEMPAITLPFKMPEMLTTKKTGKKKKKKHKKLGFEEF